MKPMRHVPPRDCRLVAALDRLLAIREVFEVELEILDVVERWYHSEKGFLSTARAGCDPGGEGRR